MGHVRKYALVLIDLQYEFEAARRLDLQESIIAEIERAKRLKQPILNVLYKQCGAMIRSIYKAQETYSKSHTIYKDHDDGGHEVFNWLYRRNPRHLRVGGVNSDCCVWETINTLSYEFEEAERFSNRRIQVVNKCIATISSSLTHDKYIRKFDRTFSNVEVV